MTLEEKEKVGGLSARQVETEHITDLGAQIMSRTLYPETVALCEDIGSGSELCRTPLQIRLYNKGTPSLSVLPLPLVILRTLLIGQEPQRHFHSQNTTVCSCTGLCR
jgi:protoporphyrinogen oxidase